MLKAIEIPRKNKYLFPFWPASPLGESINLFAKRINRGIQIIAALSETNSEKPIIREQREKEIADKMLADLPSLKSRQRA